MLPFFFRHYDQWVDHYILYDDRSTDSTLEILAAHPRVEVRRFERVVADSFVLSAMLLHNSVWKANRVDTDWVVITAIDEHLHHPDMRDYLARCRRAGVSIVPSLGFQMIAQTFAQPDEWLAQTQRMGAPFDHMNKLSIFDPKRIADINYRPGRHMAAPTGQVVFPVEDEVVNLHYKYLSRDYVAERHRLLATGLGPLDRAAKWGSQYDWSEAELETEWRSFASRSVDYTTLPRDGLGHPGRWWRADRI